MILIEEVEKDNKIVGAPYEVVTRWKCNKCGNIYLEKKCTNDSCKNAVESEFTPIYYTIYFDDNQSINLFYQKRVFFIGTGDIEVSLPEDNGVFFLYDTTKDSNGNYPNLKDEDGNIKKQYKVSAINDGDGIYHINLGCISATAGGFTEVLTIGDENVNISADFHTQNEELEILLHNQGVDLPKDIARAFQDTNVHEMLPDWVVLNRKYKELLLNIMDIVYKKGSYQSLLSSLHWFEYGDAIKLYEYWSDPAFKKLHQKELTTIYSDTLEEMMKMYMKTTFISIAFPLEKVTKDDNGNVEYDKDGDEITNPKLTSLTEKQMKWGIEDIELKMTLLGNYFSTYFMPIHLDLLFSSVETMIFTSPYKQFTIFEDATDDIVENGERKSITLDHDLVINVTEDLKLDKYYIGDVYCTAEEDTICMDEKNRIGIIPLNVTPTNSSTEQKNLYIGLGAVIGIVLHASSLKNYQYEFKTLKVTIYKDGEVNNNISVTYGDGINTILKSSYFEDGSFIKDELAFNLFIAEAGKYAVTFELTASKDGKDITVSKSIPVNVLNPDGNMFTLHKLTRTTDPYNAKAHSFDTYLSIGDINVKIDPPYLYRPDNRLKSQLYYDDCVCNYISVCKLTSDSFYLCKNWTGDTAKDEYTSYTIDQFNADFNKGNVNDRLTNLYRDGWIGVTKEINEKIDDETYKYLVVLIAFDNNPVNMYTVRPGGSSESYNTKSSLLASGQYHRYIKDEERQSIFFNEKRFIPALWVNDENKYYTNVDKEDAIFVCIPQDQTFKYSEPTWTILNESTKESGTIKGIINPEFWCNNKKSIKHKGTYSITLNSLYGNSEISYTQKYAFRIV